jgi:hypothetical protein
MLCLAASAKIASKAARVNGTRPLDDNRTNTAWVSGFFGESRLLLMSVTRNCGSFHSSWVHLVLSERPKDSVSAVISCVSGPRFGDVGNVGTAATIPIELRDYRYSSVSEVKPTVIGLAHRHFLEIEGGRTSFP